MNVYGWTISLVSYLLLSSFLMPPLLPVEQVRIATVADLTGQVLTANGNPIQNVTVDLIGPSTNLQTTTDANGDYSFVGIADNESYTISLDKNINPLNGLSAFDIILVRNYIIGGTLSNGYAELSADVNGDENVDVADLMHINRLILQLDSAFPNGVPSWGFVSTSIVLGTPPFPNPFPNSSGNVTINGNTIANFIGFKYGDANGNAPGN